MHLSYLEALTNMKFRLLNPHKELDFENMEQGKGEEYSATISRYQTECLLCISRCLESGSPEGGGGLCAGSGAEPGGASGTDGADVLL